MHKPKQRCRLMHAVSASRDVHYGTDTMHCILTPADQRHADEECLRDEPEHQHQFPEHEHSLCPHPQETGEGEVLCEGREVGAKYGDVHGFCLGVVDNDLAAKGE